MASLDVLTIVWGRKYVDLFRDALLRSFKWGDNLEFLSQKGVRWNICTDEEFKPEIQSLIPPGIHFNIKSTEELRDFIDQTQSAMVWQINECIEKKRRLLMAPPDTIFSNGSLNNIWRMGQDEGSCVFVPHVRCQPSILKEMVLSKSSLLVREAFVYLHRSWSEAEKGHEFQNSYIGGVEWEELEPNLYAVTHRLPTPYLIDFTKEDLEYFKSANSFGHFDHMWPADILVPRGRMRYCGSSDAAFIIEITEHDKNVPPFKIGGPKRGFWRSHTHNKMNAQITAIFRGE